ncbi:DUF7385 family protein [Halohasta litorea]|uniref:Uncharacterized protein n=1 Tax=Halohasta litorea TaxID=869891 RepID=A0ABD6D9E1_9EURY|nr:hypothetical protein [Halohasta litorea]MEA1932582.1 hypothetical protein [Euryarchaeota archaeon]
MDDTATSEAAEPEIDEEESLDELVNYLTPRRDNEMMATYQNTTSIACPACGDPFDYLVVCKQDQTSLSLSDVMDLCVSADHDGRPFLFTHE